MKIEQGEHMSYPPKFEDVVAWQLARELTRKLTKENTPEPRTFEPLQKGNPEPLNLEPRTCDGCRHEISTLLLSSRA